MYLESLAFTVDGKSKVPKPALRGVHIGWGATLAMVFNEGGYARRRRDKIFSTFAEPRSYITYQQPIGKVGGSFARKK